VECYAHLNLIYSFDFCVAIPIFDYDYVTEWSPVAGFTSR